MDHRRSVGALAWASLALCREKSLTAKTPRSPKGHSFDASIEKPEASNRGLQKFPSFSPKALLTRGVLGALAVKNFGLGLVFLVLVSAGPGIGVGFAGEVPAPFSRENLITAMERGSRNERLVIRVLSKQRRFSA